VKFIIFLSVILVQTNSFCQSSSQKHSGSGDNVARDKIINNYYYKNPEKVPIIVFNKLINVKERIYIFFGDNVISLDSQKLKSGFTSRAVGLDSIIFKLRLVNGRLFLSADVNDFEDRYVARVRENKLIPQEKEKYFINATEHSYEVFNEYFTPVFQMEIVKKYNAIYFGGVFNNEKGYSIVTPEKGIATYLFEKPKLNYTLPERDSLKIVYKENQKEIKAIIENKFAIEIYIKKWFKEDSIKNIATLNNVKDTICQCIKAKIKSVTEVSKLKALQIFCFNRIDEDKFNRCRKALRLNENSTDGIRLFIRVLNQEVLKSCEEYKKRVKYQEKEKE
jgi:hypothetical protein